MILLRPQNQVFTIEPSERCRPNSPDTVHTITAADRRCRRRLLARQTSETQASRRARLVRVLYQKSFIR